jgi:hypothetical protein
MMQFKLLAKQEQANLKTSRMKKIIFGQKLMKWRLKNTKNDNATQIIP